MQYILMLYSNQAGWATLNQAEQRQAMAAYGAYTEALEKAKALRSVNRLGPASSATTLRLENGKLRVLDGPYADTKEQLGGYYVIEVADFDSALAWAARCPGAAHGVVEVRPFWNEPS